MSTVATIQPTIDSNNHQVLALLDNSSSSSANTDDHTTHNQDKDASTTMMTEEEEEKQKQQILSYLNEPSSPNPSFTTSKRVPRLGPFLLLKTLGVGEFGKVKMGRHFESGQIVRSSFIR